MYVKGETYLCPHGHMHETVFEEMPAGYATERWLGARKEEPYLRCPICTATFSTRSINNYLARQ